jgi:hypothetical protein
MFYTAKKSHKRNTEKFNKMIEENNVKEYVGAYLVEGLPGVDKDIHCFVTANEVGLRILTNQVECRKFDIAKDKIIDFKISSEKDLTINHYNRVGKVETIKFHVKKSKDSIVKYVNDMIEHRD